MTRRSSTTSSASPPSCPAPAGRAGVGVQEPVAIVGTGCACPDCRARARRGELNEALRVVLFEHQTRVALARLASNPDMADDYLSEATRAG